VKPTVIRGLSQRPVSTRSLTFWVNRECLPVLSQCREALNYKGMAQALATTDGAGTWTTLWISDQMPTDAVWLVEVTAVGRGSTARAVYTMVASCESTSAVVSDLGYTIISAHESSGDEDCSIRSSVDVSGRTISIEVRDEATEAMDFVGVISVTEAT
jgi:hypothetical protein